MKVGAPKGACAAYQQNRIIFHHEGHEEHEENRIQPICYRVFSIVFPFVSFVPFVVMDFDFSIYDSST